MRTLIVSDLHLQAKRPELTTLAISLFEQVAADCEQLYIIGDLFEYWIGDDARDSIANELADHLRSLVRQQQVKLYFMHGNRDFLLGEDYVNDIGGTLLRDDVHITTLGGAPTMLMHGDTLCTDDTQYQFYRRMVRNTDWQTDFLAKTVSEREATARMIRSTSKARGDRHHRDVISDINEDTLTATVEGCDIQRVIHGHTHRPAAHTHTINGKPIERLVLGDWHADHAIVAISDDTRCDLVKWDGREFSVAFG
jgi:UDP-2,3-diacylglucosamine hydrolase